MTDLPTMTEIFKAAVGKAVQNGYDIASIDFTHLERPSGLYDPYQMEFIIFTHKFAKAVWGENKLEDKDIPLGELHNKVLTLMDDTQVWEYRLQQLALSEDRFAYLKSTL